MKKLFAIAFGLLGLAGASYGQLNMLFSNESTSYADTNVWITLQRGQDPASDPTNPANVPDAMYGANSFVWNTYTNIVGSGTQVGNLFAESVRLSDIISAGGITWTGNSPSAAIYVSYGAPMPVSQYSISGVSPSATTDPSYDIPYQNFEITYDGGQGDSGDITAINFFTASLAISSYASTNATGPALQSAGFHNPTATVYNELATITGGNSSVVLTNGAGQVTRVIGPSQYGAGHQNAEDFGSYPDFGNYFAAMVSATNSTSLSNVSAYNTIPIPNNTTPYTNAQVTFLLDNTVTSSTNGYRLEATGDIITVFQSYVTNGMGGLMPGTLTATTNSGVSLIISPDGISGSETVRTNIASAYVYYGDASPGQDYIGVTGAGWNAFSNGIAGFVSGGGAEAAQVVYAQILGELSAGFAAGMVGSTNMIAEYGSTPIGELYSGDWWTMSNVVAFSDVQSEEDFYNTYADVIFQNSSNTVYGMVYSDRFIHTPTLVNTVDYQGTNVGSWLVEIGDPIAGVPEPTAAALVILGIIGFAFRNVFRKRRRLLGS